MKITLETEKRDFHRYHNRKRAAAEHQLRLQRNCIKNSSLILGQTRKRYSSQHHQSEELWLRCSRHGYKWEHSHAVLLFQIWTVHIAHPCCRKHRCVSSSFPRCLLQNTTKEESCAPVSFEKVLRLLILPALQVLWEQQVFFFSAAFKGDEAFLREWKSFRPPVNRDRGWKWTLNWIACIML